MNSLRQWCFTICEECGGVIWETLKEDREFPYLMFWFTETGTFDDGWDYWIYKGQSRAWDDDFSDENPEEIIRRRRVGGGQGGH